MQDLPPKHDLRMQMRMQNFRSLHEAAAYGARLEQVMYDERKFQQQGTYSTRSLSVDKEVKSGESSELVKMLEKLCNTMLQNSCKLFQHKEPNHKFVSKSSTDNGKTKGACFQCGEFGHWKNQCPQNVNKGHQAKPSNSLNYVGTQ